MTLSAPRSIFMLPLLFRICQPPVPIVRSETFASSNHSSLEPWAEPIQATSFKSTPKAPRSVLEKEHHSVPELPVGAATELAVFVATAGTGVTILAAGFSGTAATLALVATGFGSLVCSINRGKVGAVVTLDGF